jgi:proline iminopeptidase
MHITVNDTTLYFDVEGSELVADGPHMRERPVVLALHGGPGLDHAGFKPYLSALADTAQIIYLDLRGQGRSGRPPLDTCTMEQMVDDVAAFCRSLGITQPAVLGHSFGGFVALHLALRHPAVVGQLILVDTAASSDDMGDAMTVIEERHGAAARAAAEQVFSGQISEATMGDFQRYVLPAYVWDSAKLPILAETMGRMIVNPELMASYFADPSSGFDLRSRLGEIHAPALVVVGDYDWLLPPAASQAIASGIPEAELVIIPEAGHLPFVEQTELFLAAVRRFIATPAPVGIGGI